MTAPRQNAPELHLGESALLVCLHGIDEPGRAFQREDVDWPGLQEGVKAFKPQCGLPRGERSKQPPHEGIGIGFAAEIVDRCAHSPTVSAWAGRLKELPGGMSHAGPGD